MMSISGARLVGFRRWRHLLVLAIAWLSLNGCALTGQAIQGRVLEEGTDKPIPDAIVVAQWIGYVSSYVDSSTVCYHVLSATTDADGVYRFPAWRKEATKEWHKRVHSQRVSVLAYKPGYESSVGVHAVEYLLRSKETREERLQYLLRFLGLSSCDAQDDSDGNLKPLLRALLTESRTLARTIEDQSVVEAILYDLEILEFGFEVAERRHLERSQKN